MTRNAERQPGHALRRWRLRAGASIIGAIALGAAFSPAVAASAAGHTTPAAHRSHIVNAAGGNLRLHKIGTFNLRKLARQDARRRAKSSAGSSANHEVAPLRMPPALNAAAKAAARRSYAKTISAGSLDGFAGNVKGERGFDGLTAALNNAANTPGVGDVTPPDQGLAVGPSPAGTVEVEYINDTLNIYSPSGKTLLGAIPGYQLYGLPSSAFLSDPRAYWDPQTGHWFYTQFIFGDGVTSPLSTQFIAVSQTTNPFGGYTTFSIDTSDSSNTAGGCPCYGDFDQVGIDNSGFFIATNEFSVDGPNFNGTVIYAMSKSQLITAAQGNGPAPTVQRYAVPFASDPFAAYHLSPSSVTQGSSSPNTEYFVESNANATYGSGLEVYALLHTNILASNARPPMVETSVNTENYVFPPNAFQRSGPFPYGQSVGATGVGQLETDFAAVQEVTYADGHLYAELSTQFDLGTALMSGAAWFNLIPKAGGSSISVTNAGNGYVESNRYILYPVIGVNAAGHGYMNFAVSNGSHFPSTAYVTFSAKGPGSVIHIAANGVNPLDDFSCYPPFSAGSCRYGDYSMAQNYNGRIYMASEYVAPQPRDHFSNWSTRIWSAPIP